MIGPLYGAAIVAVASWRAIFWINVPISIVLGLGFWLTRSSPARSSPARSSPTRASPTRSSPTRSSPTRSGPARPNRSSPGTGRSGPADGRAARRGRHGPDRGGHRRSDHRARCAPEPGHQRQLRAGLVAGGRGSVGAVHHPHRAGVRRPPGRLRLPGNAWPRAASGCWCGSTGSGPCWRRPTFPARSSWPPPSAAWSCCSPPPTRAGRWLPRAPRCSAPVLVVFIALFWWRERQAAVPLIEPRVFAARPAWGALVVNLAVGAALMAALVDVPLFARSTVDPTSEVSAALVLVRFLVAVPIGAVAGGALCRRRSLAPLVAAAGMGMAAVSFVAMTSWSATALGGGPRWSDVELVVCGLGFGLAIAPVNVAILGAVQPTRSRPGQRPGGRRPHHRHAGRPVGPDRGRPPPLLPGPGPHRLAVRALPEESGLVPGLRQRHHRRR